MLTNIILSRWESTWCHTQGVIPKIYSHLENSRRDCIITGLLMSSLSNTLSKCLQHEKELSMSVCGYVRLVNTHILCYGFIWHGMIPWHYYWPKWRRLSLAASLHALCQSAPECSDAWVRSRSDVYDPNRRRKLRSYMRPVTASVTVRINVKIDSDFIVHSSSIGSADRSGLLLYWYVTPNSKGWQKQGPGARQQNAHHTWQLP